MLGYNCGLNPELDNFNYKNINNTKARDKVLEIMNIMENTFVKSFCQNQNSDKNF